MIKVHTSDGLTKSFDLTCRMDAECWDQFSTDKAFTKEITGMAILRRSVMYTFPLPRRFKSISFGAKLIIGDSDKNQGKVIGEYLYCLADDIKVSLLVYHTNKLSRVDVVKVGKPRYHHKTKFKKPEALGSLSDAKGFEDLKRVAVK